MGSPLSEAMVNMLKITNKPLYYARYVDETFATFSTGTTSYDCPDHVARAVFDLGTQMLESFVNN